MRLGIVDCDTSHVVAFTQRLHHTGVPEDQWVDGAKVVAAFRGTSEIVGPERIDGYVRSLGDLGVELVDDPADLVGRVDAVLVESNQGARHAGHAIPFLERGIPVFVDKPFASTAVDARRMTAAAPTTMASRPFASARWSRPSWTPARSIVSCCARSWPPLPVVNRL